MVIVILSLEMANRPPVTPAGSNRTPTLASSSQTPAAISLAFSVKNEINVMKRCKWDVRVHFRALQEVSPPVLQGEQVVLVHLT